jgi:hypothetical protein
MGYSTYLVFILGIISTLVTVYYLAIKDVPQLLNIFPRFIPFAVLCTAIGVPVAVAIGWVHLKRSNLYSSEADITVEANPWNYKVQPGWWREALFPALYAQLRLLHQLADRGSLVSADDRKELESLEEKLKTLIEGGFIGTPRRRMDV